MKKLLLSLGLGFLVYFGNVLFSPWAVFAVGVFQSLTSELQFEASQPSANRDVRVKSVGDEPVAIQVRFINRKQNLDGTEVRIDDDPEAESRFFSYPPQMVLNPGEEQTIRVMWLGDKNSPEKELAYRILLEQVPVDVKPIQVNQGNKSLAIKVLTVYSIPIYITPDGASPKVVISSANHQKSKDGQDQLVVDMENQGTAHLKFFSNLKLSLKSAQGQTVILTGEQQLQGVVGENVLAGNKRQFILPWPKELPVGPVTATFDTNP